jgi:U32 family peptidase
MELLCPAGGSIDTAQTMIDAGANALYVGVAPEGIRLPLLRYSYNLRPDLFGYRPQQVDEIAKLCHRSGVRLHVTLNNLFGSAQAIESATALAGELYQRGATAVIVSNPGLVSEIKRNYPKLEVHVSIMSGVCNRASASFYKNAGADRVILERNLSVEEIAEIGRASEIDTEVFGFGSYCYNYHSYCQLSYYYYGYLCLGSCIDEYRRHGKDEARQYFFSKMIDLLPLLPQLGRAGVCSVKIEGRQYTAASLAEVVRGFRAALDNLQLPEDTRKPHEAIVAEVGMPPELTTQGFAGGEEPGFESLSMSLPKQTGDFGKRSRHFASWRGIVIMLAYFKVKGLRVLWGMIFDRVKVSVAQALGHAPAPVPEPTKDKGDYGRRIGNGSKNE